MQLDGNNYFLVLFLLLLSDFVGLSSTDLLAGVLLPKGERGSCL